jgi:glycosyltransferase involved in cell wall biosynthesis
VFVIAGNGYLRDSLKLIVSRLGLDDSVYLLESRSDIPQLLSAADVFVLPSLSEGMPLALLEAMGAGLPVIATAVNGVDTIIENADNGYLVPPKNAVALASALIKILGAGEDVWRRLGERGKRLVENEYTIDRACQQYEQLFLEKRA